MKEGWERSAAEHSQNALHSGKVIIVRGDSPVREPSSINVSEEAKQGYDIWSWSGFSVNWESIEEKLALDNLDIVFQRQT